MNSADTDEQPKPPLSLVPRRWRQWRFLDLGLFEILLLVAVVIVVSYVLVL